jgi:hypothetical protein
MLLLLALATCLSLAEALPSAFTKRLWGINIHFTSERPGEMAQISEGFHITRMDFDWASIERTPGVYNFSSYDTLLSQLQQHGVRSSLRSRVVDDCLLVLWRERFSSPAMLALTQLQIAAYWILDYGK